MTCPLLVHPIRRDEDVVLARQLARDASSRLGFDAQWQTRIATAVSEIARNAARYGGGGEVEFGVELDAPQTLRLAPNGTASDGVRSFTGRVLLRSAGRLAYGVRVRPRSEDVGLSALHEPAVWA